MYKLIIEDDEGKTTVVHLIRDELTIGRKEGNMVRLTERNVSRRHAKLVRSNGAVYIEDLQSYNGIKVNGDRIAGRAPIAEGDRIQIGDYQLALKVDKTAPGPTTASVPVAGADDKTIPFSRDEPTKTTQRAAPDAPTVASPIVAAPPEPAVPGRLVVVSSNFAGTEFVLDKPQVQIGRTQENDVVINHRSISRHHAKVLRDGGGRYHVLDLGSAYGVRVNGEEYSKVELRKGDLVDLGHVRLRFVAPGEDFVFERDAQVVDVETGVDRGKMILLAGIGALVAVLAIVLLVKLVGGGRAGGESVRATEVQSQSARLGADLDAALKAEDWDGAVAKADEALKLDPGSEAVRNKRARAQAEKKNQVIYDQYSAAARGNDLEGAVTRYQELPDDSVYHAKAQESWSVIRTAYIKEHVAKARSLENAGRCEEARKHVEAVLFVDEGNAEAQAVAERCGQGQPKRREASRPSLQRAAVVSPPSVRAHEERPAAPPAIAPAPARETANVDQEVSDAQDDYVHGNYPSAIDKARRALHVSAGNPKAWRIIGASSCFLKDKGGAVSAWNKLGPMDRQFLKYVCQRNAITIP